MLLPPMRNPLYPLTFIFSHVFTPGYSLSSSLIATITVNSKLTEGVFPSSGECATHFQQIINKFPPQVSTRSTAAAWACHVHNEVNKSLQKELFDCSNIGDFYDCGCADDEKKSKDGGGHDGKIELKIERTGGYGCLNFPHLLSQAFWAAILIIEDIGPSR